VTEMAADADLASGWQVGERGREPSLLQQSGQELANRIGSHQGNWLPPREWGTTEELAPTKGMGYHRGIGSHRCKKTRVRFEADPGSM